MHYVSTRGSAPALDFEGVTLAGLASDGGLYVPEAIPTLTGAEMAALAGLPYEEVAYRVMAPFVGDSFSEDDLRADIAAAYAGFGHEARAQMLALTGRLPDAIIACVGSNEPSARVTRAGLPVVSISTT